MLHLWYPTRSPLDLRMGATAITAQCCCSAVPQLLACDAHVRLKHNRIFSTPCWQTSQSCRIAHQQAATRNAAVAATAVQLCSTIGVPTCGGLCERPATPYASKRSAKAVTASLAAAPRNTVGRRCRRCYAAKPNCAAQILCRPSHVIACAPYSVLAAAAWSVHCSAATKTRLHRREYPQDSRHPNVICAPAVKVPA